MKTMELESLESEKRDAKMVFWFVEFKNAQNGAHECLLQISNKL